MSGDGKLSVALATACLAYATIMGSGCSKDWIVGDIAGTGECVGRGMSRKHDLLQINVVHIDSMYAVHKFNQQIVEPKQVIESNRKHGLALDTSPPEERGQFVVSVECPAIEFGTAVARMLEQIEGQYTSEDFARGRNKSPTSELSLESAKLLERS